MQSDKCLINMYISMWKLWIKNIYICLRKNKLLKKKVHWNIGLGYECVYLFIYLFHVFVVSWLCAVSLLNVQTEQTDWYV